MRRMENCKFTSLTVSIKNTFENLQLLPIYFYADSRNPRWSITICHYTLRRRKSLKKINPIFAHFGVLRTWCSTLPKRVTNIEYIDVPTTQHGGTFSYTHSPFDHLWWKGPFVRLIFFCSNNFQTFEKHIVRVYKSILCKWRAKTKEKFIQ